MIHFALGNAIDFSTHQAQSPTEIYLLIVGEEATIQAACLPIILGTDHHAGTCGPEHFLLVIILSIVTLHGIEDAAPTERVTILIEESTTSPGIFETILVVFRQELRLASCHLRMGIHELNERSEPMMRNLYITVQKHIILGFYLLQCPIVALGKTEVLLQDDGLDMRKLGFQEEHGLV